MIEFEKIKAFHSGQRYSFEELVCQLARREPPPKGLSFRRIEGEGGDGGIEGYWLVRGGHKIGYQAKFFLRAGNIAWKQIEKSVYQALATHPDLVEYVVALPCDLTDRAGVKRKGRPAWKRWHDYVAKWSREARRRLKRTVKFTPWTKSEILAKLAAPAASGLRAYFFDEIELSQEWFERHVQKAIRDLDERYHSEDHVDVAAQSLFELLTRHTRARANLSGAFKSLNPCRFVSSELNGEGLRPPAELSNEVIEGMHALIDCKSEIDLPPWEEWRAEKWKRLSSGAAEKLESLLEWGWAARQDLLTREKTEERNQKQINLESRLNDWRELERALHEISELLNRIEIDAEKARAAIIQGRAGTGKSQLLGHAAEVAVAEKRPVILILGQQLRNAPLWPQILQRLDMAGHSTQDFLGALDAAAETARTRALILIDAVNEGAGASLWKKEMASFLEEVRPYRNLACVLSCRSEYIDYVVPGGILNTIPRVHIHGFTTPSEEENAARVYLDRRGISRPATPWLSPEFVNPLFLRSCCNALQKEGRTEFPRGLIGTKTILAFFLETAGRHLGTNRDGTNDLVVRTKSTLVRIASGMADQRTDFLPRHTAEAIAEEHFEPFIPPEGLTWLEVLQRNGLVRFDPDPTVEPGDPLLEPQDIVRFSFQRFQDHLIAESLLNAVTDVKHALQDSGALSFLHDGKRTRSRYQGLIDALSVQVPEKFKIELVDALPGDVNEWWRQWGVRDAFADSIRWRDTTAFSKRTSQIFNALEGGHLNRTSLLIELSASIGHPWNAMLIHRSLLPQKMPHRDSFWTREMAAAVQNLSHPIHRLIDWCLYGQTQLVQRETQSLCALVLTWCFTLPNRPIRDRATKALTQLLLFREDIFSDLLVSFRDVDDLYVLERLFGAAYGACCLDPSPTRLGNYSKITVDTVFSRKSGPPKNLLLRDYARGIIECAHQVGVLSKKINILCCRPPYNSRRPKLNVSEKLVTKLATVAGDRTILLSCTNHLNDFARYEIEHAVADFSSVPVQNPPPLTGEERLDRFRDEIIAGNSRRLNAFERLTTAVTVAKTSQFLAILDSKRPDSKKVATSKRSVAIHSLETDLLSLLNESEHRRYFAEARSAIGIGERPIRETPRIDVAAAQRWIAKRAYEYGWTEKLFPNEGNRSDLSRDRPQHERLGKKYQWLALEELLCRLADNFWMAGSYRHKTKVYDNPLDIGFFRDIDPTILPRREQSHTAQGEREAWVLGPEISILEIPERELPKWPYLSDPAKIFPSLLKRFDPAGAPWIPLYEHRSADVHYDKQRSMLHGLRQQEFRFVFCVVIEKKAKRDFLAEISRRRKIDGFDWHAPEYTDGPFLMESSWRSTWSDEKWNQVWSFPKVAFPLNDYRWESHLDASLPKGASAFVPAPWLIRELNLRPLPYDQSAFRDVAGSLRFIGTHQEPQGSSALIDAKLFENYLKRASLDCVWIFLGERAAWPGGGERAAWRRTSGVCWIESGRPVTKVWREDTNTLDRVPRRKM